jgi:malate dehydrogenase
LVGHAQSLQYFTEVMTTVAVIGAGDLGGAIVHALAPSGRVRRIVVVDDRASVAAGKALDVQQAGAIAGWHVELTGTDDISRVTGSAVCVLADRSGPPAAEWRGEEAAALVTRLAAYQGRGAIVFAGAGQADVLLAAARDGGVDDRRLIGSSPEALASAVRALVALEARCSPGEVMLTVLGAPPKGFVVPWSEASIGGHALTSVLSQAQLARLEDKLAPLWPPGPYGLGLAAARVVEGLIGSSRRRFSVLTLLNGEFGVRHRVGVLPCLLSASGVVHARVPDLNTRERVQLETALALRL